MATYNIAVQDLLNRIEEIETEVKKMLFSHGLYFITTDPNITLEPGQVIHEYEKERFLMETDPNGHKKVVRKL